MSDPDPTDPAFTEQARLLFAGPCDFMRGIDDLRHLPGDEFPEIAFAGRSNVGKSSLINALTGRKTMARTSNTPGRTQQLNFFLLGSTLVLVDMPGHGYAAVSKSLIASWEKLIRTYLRGRPNLRCVLVLVDSRHGLKPNDEELMDMLDQSAVPYRIVMTKADKIKGSERAELEEATIARLKKHPAAWPALHWTSSETGDGIQDLRDIILKLAL